ncbi:hypothetical protein Tco_0154801 [Tanacetum coccineum]
MVTTLETQIEMYPNFEAMIAAAVANALPNLTAALRTQITNDIRNGAESSGGSGVGGDAFADTCTWVAFREIFYNRYFPASEQQRYEREYGSIYQLDRENSAAGEAQKGPARHFKWGLKKGIGVMIRDDSIFGSDRGFYGRNGNDRQGQVLASQERRVTEDFAFLHLFVLACGKAHPGVCYKLLGDVYLRSTQHKVKYFPSEAMKQNMPTDLLGYLLQQDGFIATHVIMRPRPQRIRPSNIYFLSINAPSFDVISCMVGLASQRATMMICYDCDLWVTFRQPEFVYLVPHRLSPYAISCYGRARDLDFSGAKVFLASVMDTSLESPNIENLSVVREFTDVFFPR